MMLKVMDLQKLFSKKDMLQEVMEILVPLLILRKEILKTMLTSVEIAILTEQETINSHVAIVEIT